MKADNANLLATFQHCLAGLTLWSETKSPYTVMIWETAERGEFSVEALLRLFRYLRLVDTHDLFSDIVHVLLKFMNSRKTYDSSQS